MLRDVNERTRSVKMGWDGAYIARSFLGPLVFDILSAYFLKAG
jgi:hypothetical protein